MRSFISAMIIAASFALLVPDNQSLRAAESFRALPEAAYATAAFPVSTSSSESAATPAGNVT